MEWDMIPQGTERQSIRVAPSSSFEPGRAIPSSWERFDVVVLVRQLIGGMQIAQV